MVVVVCLAAKDAAAVGGEVQVDERLGHRVAVVVRGRLEGHEGVDVDGADGEPVGAVVVRVDGAARADRVLLVAAVPLAGGGQAEGDPDCGREGALGDLQSKQFANVSNDALKREKGDRAKAGCVLEFQVSGLKVRVCVRCKRLLVHFLVSSVLAAPDTTIMLDSFPSSHLPQLV